MALTDKLTAIANAIRGKTGGTELLTLDEMPAEINSISSGEGGQSEELDDVVLTYTPSSTTPVITSYQTQQSGEVRDYAFYQCVNLSSVDIPNITQLRLYCFNGCKGLQEIELPSCTYIMGSCFRDCDNLQRADIANPLISFGSYTFRSTSLDTLILRGGKLSTLSSTNTFQSSPIADGTGYIYVPQTLIEQYKVATNWVMYANQFRAIEDYPEICGVSE